MVGDLTRFDITGFLDEHMKLEPIRRAQGYFQVSDDLPAPPLRSGC